MFRSTALVLMFCCAGCSSSSTLPSARRHAIADSAQAGGAFTANYSGTTTGNGDSCNLGTKFSFSGAGAGSFIHRSTETGSLQYSRGFSCQFTGSVTLGSTLHPRNTVTVGVGPLDTPPCQHIFFGWRYVVTSGTGRFAHAAGSGHIKFNCNSDGTYTDQWTGTLTF